ncbi:MAG: ribosomal protein S18-alanine N-acetyltransferase [Aquificota bacterium]|nr:ribosomal protein S18-alanine N-acetyltransferase [Aquificota bacterium]
MELRIREMKEEDLPRVYAINRLSFTTDAWSEEAMQREFRLPYSLRFVVESGGEIVAYAFVWLIKGEAFLMTLAVAPEWRGKGVGKWFLRKIVERLKGKAEVVSLDVRKSNIPAIRLYRSLGFKVVRERLRFYSDGENALLMELQLDKIEMHAGDKGKTAEPVDR